MAAQTRRVGSSAEGKCFVNRRGNRTSILWMKFAIRAVELTIGITAFVGSQPHFADRTVEKTDFTAKKPFFATSLHADGSASRLVVIGSTKATRFPDRGLTIRNL